MMKIKNSYDCEKCLNKNICKYYDKCKLDSNKELFVKNKKGKELTENLILTITCKHYKTESETLTYSPSMRGGYLGNVPYTLCNDPNSSAGVHPNTNITISNSIDTDLTESTDLAAYACSDHLASQESSKNYTKIVTTKKHI